MRGRLHSRARRTGRQRADAESRPGRWECGWQAGAYPESSPIESRRTIVATSPVRRSALTYADQPSTDGTSFVFRAYLNIAPCKLCGQNLVEQNLGFVLVGAFGEGELADQDLPSLR